MEQNEKTNLSCRNGSIFEQRKDENDLDKTCQNESVRSRLGGKNTGHENCSSPIKDFIEKLVFDRQNFGKIRPLALFLIVLETGFVSLAISTVDLNIISPWAKNTRFYFMRTCIIVLSLLISLIEKLLFRSVSINPAQSVSLIAFSHFLFSYVFIYSKIPMIAVSGIILINKIQISTGLFLNIASSLLVSIYMAFLSYCIYNFPIYTQTAGLFVYLKQSFYNAAGDSKRVFFSSLKLSVIFSMIYFNSVNLVLRFLAFFLRIELLSPSFFYLCIHIFAISLSNTVYFFSNLIISHLIIYNSSYSSPEDGAGLYSRIDEESSEARRLWFHKLAQTHKKIKNSPMLIKSIHEYIRFEISELRDALSLMNNCKRRLDDTFYIAVPQVNKNYTKKIKECSILQSIGLRVKTEFEMFILRKKYLLYYEFLTNALSFICSENLTILSVEMASQISDLIKLIKETENAFKYDLQSKNLEKYVIN